MKPSYRVKIDSALKNSIIINKFIINKFNINSKKITLHWGAYKKELDIDISNNVCPADIVLPQQLTEKIFVPDLPYEYKIHRNNLFLGPVIGHLVAGKYFYKNPEAIKVRLLNYAEIKGLIYIFCKETVDVENKIIQGLYYDPIIESFSKGVFPYPNAMYCRASLEPKLYNYFTTNIGQKIFNYPFRINKWAYWSLLSKDPEIIEHLPVTEKYKNVKRLVNMLNKYQGVYLKPWNKSRGRGIFYINKFQRGYLIKDINSRQNFVKKEKELEKELENKIKGKYIIQQEIPFIYGYNKVDFRGYFQKDYMKNWKCKGIATKIAKKGSIISNTRNREDRLSWEKATKDIFKLNDEKAYSLREKVLELCIKTLRVIEENGYHLGDVAIDFIIDKKLKIWLLEVQLDYASLKATLTEEKQGISSDILSNPFKYAKALAEF